MKFLVDCNDYSQHPGSFEGFSESTVVLNVTAFVGLRKSGLNNPRGVRVMYGAGVAEV